MNRTTRELLLITKATRTWDETHFNEQIDKLMAIADKVDTHHAVNQCTEVLDVYRHGLGEANKRSAGERPFAFTAFRN